MNVQIRTITKDLHEVIVTTDNTTTVETHYDIHLRELKDSLESVIEDIEIALGG